MPIPGCAPYIVGIRACVPAQSASFAAEHVVKGTNLRVTKTGVPNNSQLCAFQPFPHLSGLPFPPPHKGRTAPSLSGSLWDCENVCGRGPQAWQSAQLAAAPMISENCPASAETAVALAQVHFRGSSLVWGRKVLFW